VCTYYKPIINKNDSSPKFKFTKIHGNLEAAGLTIIVVSPDRKIEELYYCDDEFWMENFFETPPTITKKYQMKLQNAPLPLIVTEEMNDEYIQILNCPKFKPIRHEAIKMFSSLPHYSSWRNKRLQFFMGNRVICSLCNLKMSEKPFVISTHGLRKT